MKVKIIKENDLLNGQTLDLTYNPITDSYQGLTKSYDGKGFTPVSYRPTEVEIINE